MKAHRKACVKTKVISHTPRHKRSTLCLLTIFTSHGLMGYGFKLGDLHVGIQSCPISCICQLLCEQSLAYLCILDREHTEPECFSTMNNRLRTYKCWLPMMIPHKFLVCDGLYAIMTLVDLVTSHISICSWLTHV